MAKRYGVWSNATKKGSVLEAYEMNTIWPAKDQCEKRITLTSAKFMSEKTHTSTANPDHVENCLEIPDNLVETVITFTRSKSTPRITTKLFGIPSIDVQHLRVDKADECYFFL